MRVMPVMSMVLLALPGWAQAAAAPPAPPPLSAAPPAFTAAQVEAGRSLYARQCAACHGAAQEGGEAGPALRGTAFMAEWGPVR